MQFFLHYQLWLAVSEILVLYLPSRWIKYNIVTKCIFSAVQLQSRHCFSNKIQWSEFVIIKKFINNILLKWKASLRVQNYQKNTKTLSSKSCNIFLRVKVLSKC